jgi:enoyl-CoA hydratase/carnithine racemase
MEIVRTPPPPLAVGIERDVAIVTLNRTSRRNALTSEVRRGLRAAIDELGADERVRAIVLASNGSSFSSGQDLGEAKDFPAEFIPAWIREHMDLYRAVATYPRPLLAAVDGCCVGAGLQMALLCDLRLGSPSAYFTMPELDDAIPCILGVWTLWDVIGRARTAEMVLTNRAVGAEEALRWGLLTEVVADPDQVLARTVELARRMADKPALAFRLTKERMAQLMLQDAEALAVHASYAHIQAFASGQPRAAMLAFLEHRRTRPDAALVDDAPAATVR